MKEFIEIVKKKDCGTVSIEPRLRFIKDCQYIMNVLKFTTTTSHGRKIVYQKRSKEDFGRNRGFGDACNDAIKLGLLAEQNMKKLLEKLPDVSAVIVMPNGQAMNDEDYTKLHQSAIASNVSI